MNIYTRAFLFLSAAILLLVGLTVSLAPDQLYATQGAPLLGNVTLSSDVRSSGTLILLIGLLVLNDTVRGKDPQRALALSALAYLGYGVGRLVAFGIDGMPGSSVILVAGIEWAMALAALALMRKPRTRTGHHRLAA